MYVLAITAQIFITRLILNVRGENSPLAVNVMNKPLYCMVLVLFNQPNNSDNN